MSQMPNTSRYRLDGRIDGEEDVPSQIQEIPVTLLPELPENWTSGLSWDDRIKNRKDDFTDEERAEAWAQVDEAVKTVSDEMVQRWKDEMDTLLVYAGLFSAVLTAFNVQSYPLMSPPTPDPVLAALTQISAQLSSFSLNSAFVNSSQPAFQQSDTPSQSTLTQGWIILLNALWFSSLICSLSAASIAIMVKQWLHEYSSGISGQARQTARLRQHRYNGLVRWKVAGIIAILPMLLQAALGLFLAGLLVLLWNLNDTVAITASILVGMLLIFTFATIVLPTFSSDCAYLSPLSVSLFYLSHPLRKLLRSTRTTLYQSLRSVLDPASFNASFVGRVKRWCYDACREPASVEPEGSPAPTIYVMQSYVVARNPVALDQDILVTAYSTTRDIGLLDYASTCFSGHDLYDLVALLARIHNQNRKFGQRRNFWASSQWTRYLPFDMVSDMLLLDARREEGDPCLTDGKISGWVREYTLYHCEERAISNGARSSYVLTNTTAALYSKGWRTNAAACLRVLRSQLDALVREDVTLSEQVLKHVIAAIYAVVHNDLLAIDVLGLCQLILESCGPHMSQLGDTTPFSDAVAFIEDKRSEEMRRYTRPIRASTDFSTFDGSLVDFLSMYEDAPREQLARSSDVLVNDLLDFFEAIPEDVINLWRWKVLRQRLVSIRKERDSATQA